MKLYVKNSKQIKSINFRQPSDCTPIVHIELTCNKLIKLVTVKFNII